MSIELGYWLIPLAISISVRFWAKTHFIKVNSDGLPDLGAGINNLFYDAAAWIITLSAWLIWALTKI